jgi:hypothetical protein
VNKTSKNLMNSYNMSLNWSIHKIHICVKLVRLLLILENYIELQSWILIVMLIF